MSAALPKLTLSRVIVQDDALKSLRKMIGCSLNKFIFDTNVFMGMTKMCILIGGILLKLTLMRYLQPMHIPRGHITGYIAQRKAINQAPPSHFDAY